MDKKDMAIMFVLFGIILVQNLFIYKKVEKL